MCYKGFMMWTQQGALLRTLSQTWGYHCQQKLRNEPIKKKKRNVGLCCFNANIKLVLYAAEISLAYCAKTQWKCLSCSEPWVAFHNVLALGKASIAPRGHPAWGQLMQCLPVTRYPAGRPLVVFGNSRVEHVFQVCLSEGDSPRQEMQVFRKKPFHSLFVWKKRQDSIYPNLTQKMPR